MGINDAAEQLVEAQRECVRLERENTRLNRAIKTAIDLLDDGPGDRTREDIDGARRLLRSIIGEPGYADSGDWMLRCDFPGCNIGLPAIDRLRGTGEFGQGVAREIAAREGWSHDAVGDRDFCPTHFAAASFAAAKETR